jgi:HSP20 family protein
MPPIEQALEEIRALHEQITRSLGPDAALQAVQPPPAGRDPVARVLHEVARLRQAVERTCAENRSEEPVAWVPRASIYAGEAGSKIVLEIPGVFRQNVSITVTGSELVVRGKREPLDAESGLKPIIVEHSWGTFERRFPVPAWSTPESICARCAHGLLEIFMVRGGESTPVEFQVDIG